MDRKEYNSCVSKGLKGKQLSKDERKLEFCIVAKGCSKGLSREEATRICAESAANPKEPKAKRSRKGAIDPAALAGCVINLIDDTTTVTQLTTIIAGCTGQKAPPNTMEKFIKKCFKENQVTGDIREAQKLRSFCTTRWKEQEAT